MARVDSIAGHLCRDLMLEREHVNELASNPSEHYKTFLLHGRRIDAPKLELKFVQSWILDFVREESADLSPYVTAYERGRCIVSNAFAHCANAHMLTMDIRHFFRSCSEDSVRVFFEGMRIGESKRPLSAPDVSLLVQLSVYKGSLPMGSPCSPAIANRIMLPIDGEIVRALGPTCVYTRYSDDICVSSNARIDVARMVTLVGEILVRHGFELNESKVRCMGRGDSRRVTGVYIEPDGTLSIGPKRKRELNAKLYRFLVHGEGDAAEVRGLLDFARSVNPLYVTSLLLKYENYGSAARCGGVMGALALDRR